MLPYPDYMDPPQSILQSVLQNHSHLDVTSYISGENKSHIGGGGFSDIYRSYLSEDWETDDEIAMQLLHEQRSGSSSPRTTLIVVVKVLRLFGPVSTTVEKVRRLFNGKQDGN